MFLLWFVPEQGCDQGEGLSADVGQSVEGEVLTKFRINLKFSSRRDRDPPRGSATPRKSTFSANPQSTTL